MLMQKELCVIDSCGLINCSRELAGMRILDLLDQVYSIVLPEKILEEVSEIHKTRKWDLLDYALKFITARKEIIKSTNEYHKCLNVIKRWFDKQGMSENFRKFQPGELHCMALSLYLSRNEKRAVTLVTDDFKARYDGLEDFVISQQVGLVKSTAEIVVHLYTLIRGISELHVVATINDYIRNNPIRWDAKVLFLNKLEYSCRKLVLNLCFSKCL
ncbi:MAG: hypothetical protein NZ903_02815 [Candidatus Micrarchaeota archaeon]|nr:hypothetical protein [Candidatus Micrarchaeota archaeon]